MADDRFDADSGAGGHSLASFGVGALRFADRRWRSDSSSPAGRRPAVGSPTGVSLNASIVPSDGQGPYSDEPTGDPQGGETTGGSGGPGSGSGDDRRRGPAAGRAAAAAAR